MRAKDYNKKNTDLGILINYLNKLITCLFVLLIYVLAILTILKRQGIWDFIQ
jgi:hypothetical protein